MIVELIFVFLIYLSGFIFVYSLGLRGFSILAFGFIAGLALQVSIGGLQLVIGLPTTPILTAFPMLLLPLFWLLYKRNPNSISRNNLPRFFLFVTAVFVITIISVVYFFGEGWAAFTFDSYRYLLASRLMYSGRFDILSEDLLTKRMFGVPIIHMPAQMSGEFYLRSVFPLLGISTVAAVLWFIKKSLEDVLSKRVVWLMIAVAALLIISNNRFVWNMFYINGHMLCAALALIISALGWLIAQNKVNNPIRLFPLIIVSIPALIFTRPESVIIAALAIVPMVASDRFSLRQKQILLLTHGIATTIFYGYVTWFLGVGIGRFHVLYLVFGIAVICLSGLFKYLLNLKIFVFVVKHASIIAEITLWVALALLYLYNPAVLTISIRAAYENLLLGEGAWGLSFVILIAITFAILFIIDLPKNMAILRFPVTTFLPTMFLLAYLRGGAYRVGPGDSMNRMLVQIVPLVVLFIVMAISFGKPRGYREDE